MEPGYGKRSAHMLAEGPEAKKADKRTLVSG